MNMKGIVYSIKDILNGEIIYIGSTTYLLCQRKANHLHDCFTKGDCRFLYEYIRARTDRKHFYEHFIFEELYSGEFNSDEELKIKEQELLNDLKPYCNMLKAHQTKEELAKYKRDFYHNNPEYRERQKQIRHEHQKNPEYRKQQADRCRNYRKNKKTLQRH